MPDALRRLTDRGVREAREAGDVLAGRGAQITEILSSPRLRARQTAEGVRAALGDGVRVEIRDRLGCGATPADFLAELQSGHSGEVLLVAHNPELSSFASGLLARSISFRPATLVCVDLTSDSSAMAWFHHPKV